MVQFHQKKNIKIAACMILFFVFLFSLPLSSVKGIHAHTSAQRNSLEPHQIAVSRERYLKAAIAHVNRANELGYAESNYVLSGASYLPLAGSSAGFSRVSLLTHVIYTATASLIDEEYHPIAQTLKTEHAYADSNGLVLDASTVAKFQEQLTQADCLYEELDDIPSLYSLKLGDIVLTGPMGNHKISHSVLVLGKITAAEAAFMGIPNHHPDEIYFITMGSELNANYRAISDLDTTWYYDDPQLGYHVKEVYRPLYSIVDQDMGGFRLRLSDGSGIGLSRATFLLEGPNDFSQTIVMDSPEYDSEKTLPPGTYTLTETKAPLGCRVDQAPRTIEITMDAINSEYWDKPIVNEYGTCDVQVSNRDTATELPIQGAVFELSQCASFPPGGTIQLTTGEDGMTPATLFNCEKGVTVYARQVSVPSPYVLDDLMRSIAVAVDQTSSFTFYNTKREAIGETKEGDESEDGEGTEESPEVGETVSHPQPTETHVLIQKIDADAPDVFLEGAVFELYPDTEDEDVHALCFSRDGTSYVADDAGTIMWLVSDTRGQIQLRDIPLGRYRLVECEAPEGYALDPEALMFDIDEEHSSVQLVLENRKIVIGKDENEEALDKIPFTGELKGTPGGVWLVFAVLLLGMFLMKQGLGRFEECRSSSDRQ
jgi:hypothetical protein